MRVISIFLALINSLLAGLLITFLATNTDFKISMAWWSVFRILLALSIIILVCFRGFPWLRGSVLSCWCWAVYSWSPSVRLPLYGRITALP